jgi:hypothetical protein
MGGLMKLAGGLASVCLVSGFATFAQPAIAAAPGGPAAPSRLNSRVPEGRPVVIPGPGGGTLRLPSGASAFLGARRPMLRAPAGIRSASLVLFGELRADGRRYGLTAQVFVFKPGGAESETDFFVSLASDRGIHHIARTWSFEAHGYDATIRDSSFHFRRDLSRAHLETAAQLGAWGSIDMRFRADTEIENACRGRTHTRTGEARGSFTFTPQRDNGVFGTISRARFTDAELWTSNCRSGFGGGGALRCPEPSVMAVGDRFDDRNYQSFFASTSGFTEETGIESAIWQQFFPRMSVDHFILAEVPDSRIEDDSDVVRWRGSASLFLPGSASISSEGEPYLDGPYACPGAQVTFEEFFGPFLGGPGRPLSAEFATGSMTAPSS